MTTTLSDETLAYAEGVASALLGLDHLYRRESGDETGLVVLDMDTEERHPPEVFDRYEQARARWAELKEGAAGLPEADRRVYYDELGASTLAFIQWREEGLPFQDQLRRFLRVPAEPARDDELDSLRHRMGLILDSMGLSGDLAEQCSAWEARTRVEPEQVEATAAAFLDAAWERTDARLVAIPADPSDGMRVSAVRGEAYNARCDYANRTVDLNVDPVLTRPGLKHLAVHEGCPGHYVQFKLRETGAYEGTAPADVLYSVVNTASSCVFEGIADAGMEMIGWASDPDDRLQSLSNRYRAGIGTGAAWRLHALGWTSAKVRDWLAEQALTGGDGWVDNRMAFISAPSRAVLIWSYWWGEPVVAAAWRAAPPGRRVDFVRFLYGRMHSNRSVGMFE